MQKTKLFYKLRHFIIELQTNQEENITDHKLTFCKVLEYSEWHFKIKINFNVYLPLIIE